MYVKDLMNTDVVTVDPNISVSKVLDIMRENKYHRLPVVDNNNKIVGLVSESIIAKNNASNSTTLSVYELNYLLNKLNVKDIMVKNVYTISPDELLEKAATMMREKNVGCLPVVDKNNKVIGMITHNDIFTAFVDLLGYNQVGTRYVINITQDKVGVLANIASCFASENISISNLAVYNTSRGIEVVVIATGDNSGDCEETLQKANYNVTNVISLEGK